MPFLAHRSSIWPSGSFQERVLAALARLVFQHLGSRESPCSFLRPASRRAVARSLFEGEFSMGTNLYVGNLSYNTTSADLENLFSQYGTVKSAQVITDKYTSRSKGFGFVEMKDGTEAQAAIKGMHLKEHDGRCMTVNEARPREERSGGGYGGGRGRRDRY
jgi:RNA recognition motif-containing protein